MGNLVLFNAIQRNAIVDIQIRPAAPEDLERILEVQTKALKILVAEDYNPKQIESLVEGQAKARERTAEEIVFVAEQENKLIGFACLLTSTATIGGIFVDPDFVRQGVGTKLLAEIEAVAIARRYKTLYVMSSLTAVEFYQANGYQLTRESGFLSQEKVWIACVNLQKRLISSTPIERWSGEMASSILGAILIGGGLVLAIRLLTAVVEVGQSFLAPEARNSNIIAGEIEENWKPVPLIPYRCAANSTLESSEFGTAKKPTRTGTELAENDRSFTVTGTFASEALALQAFADIEAWLKSSQLASSDIRLSLFSQSLLISLTDDTVRSRLTNRMKRQGGTVLFSDFEEKSIVVYLSAQAPNTKVGAEVEEALQLYFAAVGPWELRPPWEEANIPEAQQVAEYRARYTYRKLTEVQQEDIAHLQPRFLIWRQFLAGILGDRKQLESLSREMASRYAKAQQEKIARLLASQDPKLDRETIQLFQKKVELEHQLPELTQTAPDRESVENFNQRREALYQQLAQRLGAISTETVRPPNLQTMRLSGYAQITREEQRFSFAWFSFAHIQSGLPAFADYLCDRNFSQIRYSLVDFDDVRGDRSSAPR